LAKRRPWGGGKGVWSACGEKFCMLIKRCPQRKPILVGGKRFTETDGRGKEVFEDMERAGLVKGRNAATRYRVRRGVLYLKGEYGGNRSQESHKVTLKRISCERICRKCHDNFEEEKKKA